MKNYGIDLAREQAERTETDWQFGALSQPGLANIPLDLREHYLPQGELQYGREDFMSCATIWVLNKLAADFTWLYHNNKLSPENRLWLEHKGYVDDKGDIDFSDRFSSINAGTTRNGNSLKAPLEAVRKHGLIPKWKLPASPSMTFDEYHSGITDELRDLGEEFTHRFTINYEQVNRAHIKEANKDDYLGVALHAWSQKKNGVYPKTDASLNHAVMLIRPEYEAFDNYEEKQGDFTKTLAPDYVFYDYAYRVFISAEKSYQAQVSLLQKLLGVLQQLFAALTTKPMKPDYSAMLYDEAYKAIGTDVSPDDLASDLLGCAESLSQIIRKTFPELHFPIVLSTRELYLYLTKSPSFQQIDEPQKGCIVLNVTGSGNGAVPNGHVGVLGREWIMSNHSKTGTWEPSYTLETWNAYFQKKGGMPTLFFTRV